MPKEELFPKTCNCCGRKITEDEWERLRYVGIQTSGIDGFPDLELRSCTCASTLAVTVPGDYEDVNFYG